MKTYIVVYDESDDRTRSQIAKVLLKYGSRVQYSVFEVTVRNGGQLKRLCERLKKAAPESSDVRLYRLCENCRKESFTLAGEKIAGLPAVIIL